MKAGEGPEASEARRGKARKLKGLAYGKAAKS